MQRSRLGGECGRATHFLDFSGTKWFFCDPLAAQDSPEIPFFEYTAQLGGDIQMVSIDTPLAGSNPLPLTALVARGQVVS